MFSSQNSQVVATSTQAEAVDFDGTNDYLSRSSALSGAANSKTFTLSFWFWAPTPSADCTFYEEDTGSSYRFVVEWIVSSTTLRVYARNTSGTNILVANYVLQLSALANTFYHILVSVDLANTSNRYFYVNDEAVSPAWATYTNQDIGFANSTRYVVANDLINTGLYAKTRLSNFYRDNTYRNLSITANRRLFITADLKPAAGQAALSPILYLPMSDPTTVGTNAGTGGNFTLTGTIARSGRGPNQYNAPYSDLDGSADYLERTTAPTGIADGKAFTISYAIRPDTTGENYVFSIASSTTNRFYVAGNGGKIQVSAWNSAGTRILLAETTQVQYVVGRNNSVVISIDLSSTANRAITVNGAAVTVTWATYTNDTIDFNVATSPVYRVGCDSSTTFFNGKLGAVWFNTSYIDLSVASNLAKFVTGTGIDAKPVDLGATGELPTGTSPLIYLPMYGNNAGKNYGTGGDFTAVSGPYTGARGPNEFWGNRADFNGTTGRLTKSSALTGVSDGKTISGSFWVMFDNASTNVRILTEATGSSNRLLITRTSGNALQIGIFNSSGGDVVNVSTIAGIFSSGTQYSVQFCFDVTNAAKRKIYINSEDMTLSVAAYNNQDMVFSGDNWTFGALYTGTYSQYLDGKLSEFYLTTEYIDFSQEANRLKFRDCFGNPTDLPSAITALSVPNPAIYMRFPPTSFGTNSGTGGDFTVNGTITDGGQL